MAERVNHEKSKDLSEGLQPYGFWQGLRDTVFRTNKNVNG